MKQTRSSSRAELTLIKLGGSIITNKEVPMAVRSDILERLVAEIGRAQSEWQATDQSRQLIIGHGQGSFAHAPALRYQTMKGFIREDSQIGMAITQDSAAQLNRIVVNSLIRAHLPAVSYSYSATMVTKARQAGQWSHQVLLEYLRLGLLPVTGGDVLVDSEQGCTIWSTEEVLSHLAQTLPAEGWSVKRVIHVTEVAGFLNQSGQVVPEITAANWPNLQQALTQTKGFDVTGGMGLKVEESLQLAARGIESVIISGMTVDNLYNCLVGRPFVGTLMTAN
jgi:isopentenyl phosphate kinase